MAARTDSGMVSSDPGGKALLHAIEEEGLIPLLALGAQDRGPRQRWDEPLGLDSGGRDLCGFDDLAGQHAVLD